MKLIEAYLNRLRAEVIKLKAINAALLEALEYLVEQYPNNRGMKKATEAIRKAKSHADTLKGE